AAGGELDRPLPLRSLQEQAVLRHDPSRDRVRGRRLRAARRLSRQTRRAHRGEPFTTYGDWSSETYLAAAFVVFFSALRPYCLMNFSVFACASSSTIWTGGDFIR